MVCACCCSALPKTLRPSLVYIETSGDVPRACECAHRNGERAGTSSTLQHAGGCVGALRAQFSFEL